MGLAGFPYVGYHLTFPYSVFLGPNAAQYNLPQMYWADIGTSVPRRVRRITYEYNEIYRRPIFPLGQLWHGLGRELDRAVQQGRDDYGATGVSWWDWQSRRPSYWGAMTGGAPLLGELRAVNRTHGERLPRKQGRPGDLGAGAPLRGRYKIAVDGRVRPDHAGRRQVVPAQARRLPATGVINGLTWDALVNVTPVTVGWTSEKNQRASQWSCGAPSSAHTGRHDA